ncbi:hypothetical protein LOTGIDRAFT_155025 [Lottia gigantea]|uniref:Uncharacterized protein n=1 Tax=Lottia gigantea TaxID=225164 RepID=V3ZSJ0_LOTGI|nr:hypothetical protein LOTGIDRAFT_155025 [Lottia gigantea]ESO85540.1 hypothetical protein LOTGIDRAFT_155025 [Lottia gigantea]
MFLFIFMQHIATTEGIGKLNGCCNYCSLSTGSWMKLCFMVNPSGKIPVRRSVRRGSMPFRDLKSYLQNICCSLLDGFARKKIKVGHALGEKLSRLVERHWLDEASDRPDCIVCSDCSINGGRRQTKFRCRQCCVGLCVAPCNEIYHTRKLFKQCHFDRL